jgi:transcriptional regulator with XRE-family HTH domain
MSKEVPPVLLQSVITDNMRRIRHERGVLQEDVAMAARWVGVMWSSTTVAQIESGTRQLSLDEFLLLPLILRCKISDLIAVEDDNQPVKLGFNTILDPEAVAELVSPQRPPAQRRSDPNTSRSRGKARSEDQRSDLRQRLGTDSAVIPKGS